MKFAPGLDRNSIWSYKIGLFILFVAAVINAANFFYGNPPKDVPNQFAVGCVSIISAIVSAIAYSLLGKLKIKDFIIFSVAVLGFVAAGFLSGMSSTLLLILGVPTAIMFVICLIYGDKADLDSETKYLTIRFPWKRK